MKNQRQSLYDKFDFWIEVGPFLYTILLFDSVSSSLRGERGGRKVEHVILLVCVVLFVFRNSHSRKEEL